jgi:hypothetical protein
MHIWPSKRVMKTNKDWKYAPPKGLAGKDLEEFYADERDYKHTMLGIVKKEPKGASKAEG